MSDPNANADMPTTIMPPESMFGELIEMPPAIGWVVHLVAGKPQQTQSREFWAWCKVTVDQPGYTDIVFTETDGSTIADPYPRPTADSPLLPVRLGPVVFKAFC